MAKEMKIMVVDDSDYSRKAIIEILVAAGYDVAAEANSVSSALAAAKTTPCELYIVDVVMPKASGIELVKVLNQKNQDYLYIIMISSLALDSVVVESITSGAIDFIQKPFKSTDLIKSVERIQIMIDGSGSRKK